MKSVCKTDEIVVKTKLIFEKVDFLNEAKKLDLATCFALVATLRSNTCPVLPEINPNARLLIIKVNDDTKVYDGSNLIYTGSLDPLLAYLFPYKLVEVNENNSIRSELFLNW